jgi:hypothetical protein
LTNALVAENPLNNFEANNNGSGIVFPKALKTFDDKSNKFNNS